MRLLSPPGVDPLPTALSGQGALDPRAISLRGPCRAWVLGKADGMLAQQDGGHRLPGRLGTDCSWLGKHMQGRTERGIFKPPGSRQEERKQDKTKGRNESHYWKCACGTPPQALSHSLAAEPPVTPTHPRGDLILAPHRMVRVCCK